MFTIRTIGVYHPHNSKKWKERGLLTIKSDKKELIFNMIRNTFIMHV
ncbi:hypothetical protein HMPREF9148_02531 [Prevotella sp. F0091]|nr:hypothetical protein HMPREF9148_02531 [Prevotella sp. F0091]